MTTIDELLKERPLPWRVSKQSLRYGIEDASGASVSTFPDQCQAICDAMNELVRLREENRRLEHEADMEYVASLESDALGLAAERDALRARNAELEAELGRLNDQEKPGCTDANCVFGGPCGMRTNGGCSCLDDIRPSIRANSMRAKIRGMRTRVVELEAFAERMKGAPGRLAVAMESAVMYANGEHQEGILEVVRVLRLSDLDAAIFGEGPLPWDEKGGGV